MDECLYQQTFINKSETDLDKEVNDFKKKYAGRSFTQAGEFIIGSTVFHKATVFYDPTKPIKVIIPAPITPPISTTGDFMECPDCKTTIKKNFIQGYTWKCRCGWSQL